MAQSKLYLVQSNNKFMTKEHDNITHDDAESSNFEPLSCNGEEGSTESDDEEGHGGVFFWCEISTSVDALGIARQTKKESIYP
jgi:hypothetical protein